MLSSSAAAARKQHDADRKRRQKPQYLDVSHQRGTKDKYLIEYCEEKDYYRSHTQPKGFSHGKSNSR
jgi:hypothetical protein